MSERGSGFFERMAKKGGDLAKAAVLGAKLISPDLASAETVPASHVEPTHQQEAKEAGATAASDWAPKVVGQARIDERTAPDAATAAQLLHNDVKAFARNFYFPEQPTTYTKEDYARIKTGVVDLLSTLTQADAKFGTHLVTGEEGKKAHDQLADIQLKAERGMSEGHRLTNEEVFQAINIAM